ncbi:MAG: ATP-dependent Clp protease proteolytic subunit [Patescibacteria group bacterium]
MGENITSAKPTDTKPVDISPGVALRVAPAPAQKKDDLPSEGIGQVTLDDFKKDKDVLLMLYSKDEIGNFHYSINQDDEIKIYEILKNKTEFKKSLLIYLDTPGGNVYSAVKIMDMLREKYETIEIAIAQEAKSSGTMMCLAADKLIMSCISELGPLDKPMKHPDDEMVTISALDIAKSLDTIISTAIDKQKILATQLIEEYRISSEKCLDIAGKFVANLISPMIAKQDVKIYNTALRLLSIAQMYGKELLSKNMLKYVKKDSLREKIADMVIKKLVWEYPDHGFAIRREELRDWFFKVDNAESAGLPIELWDHFKANIGNVKRKVIKFL